MRAVFRETPDPPCRNRDYTKGIITARAGGPGVFCIRDLGVAIIGAGIIALLVVVALAVGLVTHPIRTLALVLHKLAALAAGLALILALIVGSVIIRTLAEWVLERPTRAERRAMKRAAAQIPGGTTM